MPHLIWKGAVSFGLVHVPVKLYPATVHTSVGFDLLDKKTLDPIGYRKINKRTGKEVGKDDIVRGIEHSKGEYVVLSDDEIRSANVKSTQTVDILAFVDAPEISFLYLDTPYFLAPDKGGNKVYALLREALKRAGKIGIANLVMHGKQHLAALVPSGPVLALNTLRWADEVRDLSELTLPAEDVKSAGLSSKEVDMAMRLIEDMSEKWQPDQYRDTFHDDILALVDRKIKAGKTQQVEAVEPVSAPRADNVVDLSDLLRRSLGGGRAVAAAGSTRRSDAESDSQSGESDGDETAKAPKSAARKLPATKRAPATKRRGGKAAGTTGSPPASAKKSSSTRRAA